MSWMKKKQIWFREDLLMEEQKNTEEKENIMTEIPKEEEWNAQEVCAVVDALCVLPVSPKWPFLVKFSLEGSCSLTDIPSSFFEHMPLLQQLNLSGTSIKSLPVSLPKLIALKILLLRNCDLFMELSPQVGELHNLEVLDLDQTKILCLPNEVGKLSKLTFLRVCFDEYVDCDEPEEEYVQQKALVQPGTISALTQLTELSIGVDPQDERWNAVVQVIVEEACRLEALVCLKLFLPDIEILRKFKEDMPSWSCYSPFSRFNFTVGQHKQRTVSRVPKKVEACFEECDKCLKFVKGKNIPSEMQRLLAGTTALYLDRHATVNSLCDFGVKNMQELELCVLVECNGMQNIVDGRNSYEEFVLLSLQYLHVYYLENLVRIYRFPIHDHQQCLSGLKCLTLHSCPRLRVILSPALVANLAKLEVLIVEDCPEVTSLVSPTTDDDASLVFSSDCSLLPRLETILLLFLPKLDSIFGGYQITTKLEKMGIYNCPKLEFVSAGEISIENLKVIKGESDWWQSLKWLEAATPLDDHLNSIFSPILEERDVMTQMEEMLVSKMEEHETRTNKLNDMRPPSISIKSKLGSNQFKNKGKKIENLPPLQDWIINEREKMEAEISSSLFSQLIYKDS